MQIKTGPDTSFMPTWIRATVTEKPHHAKRGGLFNCKITRLFRPRDRTSENDGNFVHKNRQAVGTVIVSGNYSQRENPTYDAIQSARILGRKAISLNDLKYSDALGTYSWTRGRDNLVRHLKSIYGNWDAAAEPIVTQYQIRVHPNGRGPLIPLDAQLHLNHHPLKKQLAINRVNARARPYRGQP